MLFSTLEFPVGELNGPAVYTADDLAAGVVPSGPVVVFDFDNYYLAGAIAEQLAKTVGDVSYVTTAGNASAWTFMTNELPLVHRALADKERGLGDAALKLGVGAIDEIARYAGGDARRALGTLEIAAEFAQNAGATILTPEHIRESAQQKALLYDRAGEEHYNVISAFIKSLRGSDPDASVYWMMRMVEAGEDPLFIARRMVIFASEDVGNADPRALQVAIAVKEAVDFVGMPEGVIPLAQGVTYLASAPKSNASYLAMRAAAEDAKTLGALPVPLHLRNAPTPMMKGLGYGKDYRYPHDYQGALVAQNYLPDELGEKIYYQPSERGYEIRIREFLARAREARKKP